MVKYTQTIRWLLPTHCLSEFDHFVGLSLEKLMQKYIRDTEYLFVFSPNAGKYGPEKTPNTDTFHEVNLTYNPKRWL